MRRHLPFLCGLICAVQLTGWAVYSAATGDLPPLATLAALATGLMLAAGQIHSAVTESAEPPSEAARARDEQTRMFLLPRVVIAAAFVGIAALVISAGGAA